MTEARQHDGHGINRVTQEANEDLNERDLDKQKREPDAKKVADHHAAGPRGIGTSTAVAAYPRQGKQDQHDAHDQRLDQRGDQYNVSQLQQTHATAGAKRE
jgi:hypothetical protein